jgi:plasmid stability protein
MWGAWVHVVRMGKTVMVQIRNVPVEIHRKLKARAAEEGISLSEYVLRDMRKSAERPTNKEILERLAKLPPIITKTSSADMVRQGREERVHELDRRAEERRRR